MPTKHQRRRLSHRRSRTQRGGSRTVLPISYFGGDDSHSYTGKCGRTSFRTAFGESVPTSFGTLGTSLGPDFAGPNLAPGGPGNEPTNIQTGGRRRRSNRRRSTRSRKQRTSRNGRRQNTRSRRTRTKRVTTSRRRRNVVQRGGGGQYGRTVLPISYFGGNDSAAYTAPCGRTTFDTAYGNSVATSFGSDAHGLPKGFAGPNLAPGGMGEGFAVTGIQTGGGRRRAKRSKQMRRR
jgi:hypothetical protein